MTKPDETPKAKKPKEEAAPKVNKDGLEPGANVSFDEIIKADKSREKEG